MGVVEKQNLRLALSILSGRRKPANLSEGEVEFMLDLDPDDTSDFEILQTAEEIVFSAIVDAFETKD